MKRVLIDSDICLDVFLNRKLFVKNSSLILSAAEGGEFQAFVSGISFDNIYYVLRKNSDTTIAIKQIGKLRKIVSVGSVTEFTINAISAGWKDFEDALQYFCAKENNCEAIITRNAKDFKEAEIDVYNPTSFLNKFRLP